LPPFIRQTKDFANAPVCRRGRFKRWAPHWGL